VRVGGGERLGGAGRPDLQPQDGPGSQGRSASNWSQAKGACDVARAPMRSTCRTMRAFVGAEKYWKAIEW
jgi:hypothetical protein